MDWTYIAIIAAAAVLFLAFRQLGSMSPAKARAALQQGAKVIDVRSEAEYRSGHLPGTINIPLDALSERISRQVPDKNQTLLLHCVSGGRSGMGKRILQNLGYTKVFNLGSYGRAEKILRDTGK